MRLDWWTLALQALNFLLLVWLLWHFLYRPVRAVVEKRRQLAQQALAEADKSKAAATASRERYEKEEAGLQDERQKMLQGAHAALDAERDKVLAKAKEKAQKLVDDARARAEKEKTAALAESRDQVAALAAELAAKLLSDLGPGAAGDAVLDRIEMHLQSLPTAERQRLAKDLEPKTARLTIVTAAPMDPDAQARWTDRLDANLSSGGRTEFAVDPSILGGAELRLPHAALKLTWAESLRKAEQLLGSDEPAA